MSARNKSKVTPKRAYSKEASVLMACNACATCAQMVLLALITALATVVRILDHLRIPSTPPPIAPAQVPGHQTDLLDVSELRSLQV